MTTCSSFQQGGRKQEDDIAQVTSISWRTGWEQFEIQGSVSPGMSRRHTMPVTRLKTELFLSFMRLLFEYFSQFQTNVFCEPFFKWQYFMTVTPFQSNHRPRLTWGPTVCSLDIGDKGGRLDAHMLPYRLRLFCFVRDRIIVLAICSADATCSKFKDKCQNNAACRKPCKATQ